MSKVTDVEVSAFSECFLLFSGFDTACTVALTGPTWYFMFYCTLSHFSDLIYLDEGNDIDIENYQQFPNPINEAKLCCVQITKKHAYGIS